MTIDILPDDALLEIFDYYVKEMVGFYVSPLAQPGWHALVHVCRKWRNVVFGSPRRLNLQLLCKSRTPVKETLDAWPLFPIIVRSHDPEEYGVDNLVAALEHNGRVIEIFIENLSSSQFEKVFAAMQRPFPALTNLSIDFAYGTALIDPASFLGGAVPGLKSLSLYGNISPGLLKLLLSATDLVTLQLRMIHLSVHISPEVLVTCLSVLTRLEKLEIGAESRQIHPDHSHLPPRTLTHITSLEFYGGSEYLDDLMARIDAPLLDDLHIILFHQSIFHTPQLTQFIARTPKFNTHDTVHLIISNVFASVTAFDKRLRFSIICGQSDQRLPSMTQICSSVLPRAVILAVERLFILQCPGARPPMPWRDSVENSQWLEIIRPFTAVKRLYISSEFTARIVPFLQGLVEERVARVLPALQNFFLEETILSGPVQEAFGQFIGARQLAGHPVAIFHWERNRF